MKVSKRILLLKMDHLGDALWSFPALHALRTTFPDCRLDMLCTSYLSGVFERLDLLDHIFQYDSAWPLSRRWRALAQLRRTQYDAAIVLGPVDKINHLAFLSGAKERWGYAYNRNLLRSLARRGFLTWWKPHPANVAAAAQRQLPHEVSVMLELVAQFSSRQYTNTRLFFPLREQERVAARQRLSELHPNKARFAILHLCAKSFRHGWNEQFLADLADQLQQALPDTGWIISAGPSEQSCLPAYQAALTNHRLPVVDDLSLEQMAALLAEARLLVSWDTGVVHLSTAVGTPVVDIFSDKNFAYCVQRWGPWQSRSQIIRQEEPAADRRTVERILQAVIQLNAKDKEATSP